MVWVACYTGKKLKVKDGVVVEKSKTINILYPCTKPNKKKSAKDEESGFVSEISPKVQLLKNIVKEHDEFYDGRCKLYGTVTTENDFYTDEMFRDKRNFICKKELGKSLLDNPDGLFCQLLAREFKIGTVRYIVFVALLTLYTVHS